MSPGVPKAAAYRYTHWVACKTLDRTDWFYDVNAGGWLTLPEWERVIAPAIMATIRRCDDYDFTHRWEVRKSPRG
jgi:hypothetical protein